MHEKAVLGEVLPYRGRVVVQPTLRAEKSSGRMEASRKATNKRMDMFQ